jgi:hypothetical protein
MKKEEIKTLNVTPISLELPKVKNEYESDIRISHLEDKSYMILEREFTFEFSKSDYHNNDWEVDVVSNPVSGIANKQNFIVDMNGIDNFITSKAMIFKDSHIRKIVAANFDEVGRSSYLRFGVAGARPNNFHPGGEVVEFQELDFVENTGKSKSVSGYLRDKGENYSSAIMLSEDGINLRDERTVYSHSAWINNEKKTPLIINAVANNDEVSVLDLIYDYCCENKKSGAAIKLELDGDDSIKIKGRVLKHIPERAFTELQEATDIAVEQEFVLPPNSKMEMYGTLYKRFEPEWKEFTNGRQYERRGHYHAVILDNETEELHEVFHVREMLIKKGCRITIEMFPIDRVYRIYPIEKDGEKYKIISSNKDIREHAKDFESQTIDL